MNWRHRGFNVGHSRDGWVLTVDDEPWVMTLAEKVVHGILAGLGHPCCGRGLLRGPLTNSDMGQLFWHRVMNLPNGLYRWNRHVARIPLSREQAELLAPEWVLEREAWDDED